MKIISFNTRGLSDFNKFRRIIHKLRLHRPDIILLQETFTNAHTNLDLNHIQNTWNNIWQGDIYLSNHIAILVSPSLSSTQIFQSPDNRIIDISLKSHTNQTIYIRNIYAPSGGHTTSQQFWDNLPPNPPNPLIVGGDFNKTSSTLDHQSSQGSRRHPNTTFIPSLFPSLIDLATTQTQQPQFTCFTNRVNGWTKSRIDYILIHPSLILPTHRCSTFHMGADSDHRAVILTHTKDNQLGKSIQPSSSNPLSIKSYKTS